MKRIYTTLALLGALVTGAFAQTRHCDIETVFLAPADNSTVNCTDSFTAGYAFINHGPDNILATDTFAFADFESTITSSSLQGIYLATPENAVTGVGDTIALIAFKSHYNNIGTLIESTGGTFVNPPFADGTYGIFGLFIGVGHLSGNTFTQDTTIVNDTAASNDVGFAVINLSCPTTGIKDLKNGVSLNVYPNPASNQISFNYDFTAATQASLRVTDIAGRVVKTITLGKQNAGSKTFNVDIADLNNGMYYIELATESTRSISKFTKN